MKKIFQSLILLICSFVDVTEAQSTIGEPPHVVKFHIELKGWPKDKQEALNKAANQLIDSKTCWGGNSTEQKFKELSELKDGCHQFVWFENIENLEPWKRNETDRKMVLTYKRSEVEGDRIGVQIFKWDGKKLQRIRNSGSPIGKRDLLDLILSWSFK